MTYFLKLYYNIFILEIKIESPMFRKICVNLYYIMLEIPLICVIIKRNSF
jgi:hypothetical protein